MQALKSFPVFFISAILLIAAAHTAVMAADFPLPPGINLSADQISAARDILQGKSIAGLKRLTTKKGQTKTQGLDPNLRAEDSAAKRKKQKTSVIPSGTAQYGINSAPVPHKVKGEESLIVVLEPLTDIPPEIFERRRDNTSEEKKATVLETKRIPARGIYQLDKFGVLNLPNTPPINLKGLTEDQILERLSVEPLLEGVDIAIKLLEIEPIGLEGLKPFGYDLFESETADFTPSIEVPVPADFVIGPGDVIRLQTYGKMNEEYELEVTREGTLPFPNVGSIAVAGLRFKEMKDLLQRRVEKQFIGVNINVSMGPLRTIRVFVVGEVKFPGSYTVGALATVTHALYVSGGIKEIGSLRNVTLKRNGAVVGVLDIYDLLLKGDTSKDLRLQAGDAILVPPVGPTVSILGEVRRPAIYELKGESELSSMIDVAGGLTSAANDERVQIEHIDEMRAKTTSEFNLKGAQRSKTPLHGGDIVRIFKMSTEIENTIVLHGHVQRPGKYAWREGMRISDVIATLGDLKPEADTSVIFIKRINNITHEIESVLHADLSAAWQQPKGVADIALRSLDEIFVVAHDVNRPIVLESLVAQLKREAAQGKVAQIVRVGGEVRAPGEYPLTSGMKVSDLIRAAGMLKESAYDIAGEITRFESTEGQGRDVQHVAVSLQGALKGSKSSDIVVHPYDFLVVKRIPLWSENQQIELKGEILFPGKYPIRRGERLSSVITRAGGLTKEAYTQGAIFMREELQKREQQRFNELAEFLELQMAKIAVQQSNEQKGLGDSATPVQLLTQQLRNTRAAGRVVIDLKLLLDYPGDDRFDMVLKDGDMLFLPAKMQEVSVMGEVFYATSHLFKSSLSPDDYINMSGGYTQLADKKRMYIVRANGEVMPGNNGWFSFSPKVAPGDTIVVPFEPDRVKAMTLITGISQIVYQLGVAAASWKAVGLF